MARKPAKEKALVDPSRPVESGEIEQALLQGAVCYEQGDHETAVQRIEKALRLAREHDDPKLIAWASALLGVVQMERGDLKGAVDLFGAADTSTVSDAFGPPFVHLTTLAGLSRAQRSALETEERLIQTQARIREEIHALKAEAREVSGRLLAELKRDLAPDGAPPADGVGHEDSGRTPEGQTLSVQLLGHFEARLSDGTPIKLCSNRKGQALFKLLATQPGAHYHKERLLSLFWRNDEPAVASGKLHIAVSRLRRALLREGLGDDILRFENDCYSLNSSLGIRSDVELFQSHLRSGARLEGRAERDLARAEYEAALALYQGPYVAEVVGEDWPLRERARLEADFLDLLSKLSSWYFDAGRYPASAECCRHILRYDNLREDIYRKLMRCLSRQGQRNQALRLYEECARTLEQELGVSPMRKTTELMARIRQEQPV